MIAQTACSQVSGSSIFLTIFPEISRNLLTLRVILFGYTDSHYLPADRMNNASVKIEAMIKPIPTISETVEVTVVKSEIAVTKNTTVHNRE